MTGRVYEFKVIFYEKSDEFWEELKSPDDLKSYMLDIFAEHGFEDGEDVTVVVHKTNEEDLILRQLADTLHIAGSIMMRLKEQFQELPDDVRAKLLEHVSSREAGMLPENPVRSVFPQATSPASPRFPLPAIADCFPPPAPRRSLHPCSSRRRESIPITG